MANMRFQLLNFCYAIVPTAPLMTSVHASSARERPVASESPKSMNGDLSALPNAIVTPVKERALETMNRLVESIFPSELDLCTASVVMLMVCFCTCV